jgi:hypothetical protein
MATEKLGIPSRSSALALGLPSDALTKYLSVLAATRHLVGEAVGHANFACRRLGVYPYFLAACSIAGAALPKSSGVITGWTWMVAPKPRNRGSARAGI